MTTTVKSSYEKVLDMLAIGKFAVTPETAKIIVDLLGLKQYDGSTPEYSAQYVCQLLVKNPHFKRYKNADNKFVYTAVINNTVEELMKEKEIMNNRKNFYKKKYKKEKDENQKLKEKLQKYENLFNQIISLTNISVYDNIN